MQDTHPTEESSTTRSSQDRSSARFLDVSGRLAVTMHDADTAASRDVTECLQAEFKRIQKLSGDDDLENLGAIIGAENAIDVARKLHRFALASVNPGPMLGRAIEQHDPGEFEVFCLRLSAYREFLSVVEDGATPREAADQVIVRQRQRVQEKMRPRFDAPSDEGGWMHVDADVYGADDELDLGAVRAEVDRLLDRLNVDRARIHLSLVPDEGLEE